MFKRVWTDSATTSLRTTAKSKQHEPHLCSLNCWKLGKTRSASLLLLPPSSMMSRSLNDTVGLPLLQHLRLAIFGLSFGCRRFLRLVIFGLSILRSRLLRLAIFGQSFGDSRHFRLPIFGLTLACSRLLQLAILGQSFGDSRLCGIAIWQHSLGLCPF